MLMFLGCVACPGPDGRDATSALTLAGESVTSSAGETGVPLTTGISASASETEAEAEAEASDSHDGSTGEPPGEAVWTRHTFDVQSQTWTSIPLDQVWIEPSAPPPQGIAAATSLTYFDRLWVVSTDRMFYERRNGTWQTPVALDERFPMLAGLSVATMIHVPGQHDDTIEEVYFIDNPDVVIYIAHEDGTIEHGLTTVASDEPGGPPQASGRARWSFAIVEPSLIGMDPDWLQWFIAYDDGNLYRFAADLAWSSWSLTDNPFFGVSEGQPNPLQIEAAYHDDAAGRVHFIGP